MHTFAEHGTSLSFYLYLPLLPLFLFLLYLPEAFFFKLCSSFLLFFVYHYLVLFFLSFSTASTTFFILFNPHSLFFCLFRLWFRWLFLMWLFGDRVQISKKRGTHLFPLYIRYSVTLCLLLGEDKEICNNNTFCVCRRRKKKKKRETQYETTTCYNCTKWVHN